MDSTTTRVADIMTKNLRTISPAASLDAALELMRKAGIHHLVVLRGTSAVGVLSSRDVDRARATHYKSHDDAWTVEETMTTHVVIASPDTTVRHAASLMRGHSIGCLPVVDGDDVVGIITTSDLLDLLAEAAEDPAEPVESELPEDILVGC